MLTRQSERIHLNTAGAGLMATAVVEAMTACLQQEAREGSYETEHQHSRVLGVSVYESLAGLLGAAPNEIALFDSATRAWDFFVSRLMIPAGSRILITPFEYAGSYLSLRAMADRRHAVIEVIPTTDRGDVDLDWLAARIDHDVAVVSVPHVPSGCGSVQPVEQIGSLLAQHPALFLVDGCQSVGHRAIDVSALGCDLLVGAGRKYLCGPRGTGFAYRSARLVGALAPWSRDLHAVEVQSDLSITTTDSSARIEETAERSTAAVLGLDAALRLVGDVPEAEIEEKTTALSATASAIDGLELIAPGSVQSGLVTFRHERHEPSEIVAAMASRGVTVWPIVGSHTPIYMASRGVRTAVRMSVHSYNTFDEIDTAGQVLAEVLA